MSPLNKELRVVLLGLFPRFLHTPQECWLIGFGVEGLGKFRVYGLEKGDILEPSQGMSL